MNSLPLRLAALLAVVGLFTSAAVAALFAQQPPADPPTPPPAPDTPAAVVGKAGCAGAACHGGPADLTKPAGKDCWQESLTRFQAADPHTRAFTVLKTAEARQIVKGVGGTDATTDVRCLACHSAPQHAADPIKAAEGIGCAGCHGEADKWLRPHTGWGKNPDKRPAEHKEGISGLNNIGTRAMMCAGCHVGAPATDRVPLRDMNHDMIAAGHPRLFFDLAELQRRLPKHWSEKDRVNPDNDPPAETYLWLIGRVAHAEAACELLADRATRKAPWPEFAEGNCASCHHALTGIPAGKRGRWQALWPLTKADDAPALKSLNAMMEAAVIPDAAAVKAKATEAAAQLKVLRMPKVAFPKTTDALDPDEILQLLHGLAAQDREAKQDARQKEFDEVFRLYREPTVPPADIPKVREKANGLLK